MTEDHEPRRAALTPRQREIAALIARGYTNQQVAAELVISRGTVANHIEQILRRLGLSSRVELATWAAQQGLASSQNRLLTTLERLLEIDPRDLDVALDAATAAVADGLGADKVDAFLYDPATATLIARGTSPTPLGKKQHALGLHLLPVANGGRMVEVYETGTPRHAGRVDLDKEELRGVRVGLGVRSDISVPLIVAGERRGVLAAVSNSPDFFTERDARFLATVSRWVGVVAHRAEFTQQAASDAEARSRRTAAEELVTVLAHDFRNLLTPLRGRLELLGRRARRDGHDRYVVDADALVRSVDRLDTLVRDLLDTARLEQGLFSLNRVPLNLVDLVRETAAQFTTSATSVRVEAERDELVVWADPHRFRQVLENLLSNASKVQPAAEPIVVDLDVCQDCAVLSIIDCGPGIPPDLHQRLFAPFVVGSSSSGLGLGLYLARGIAQAHGGSLELDSETAAGSRFTVRLPLEGADRTPLPGPETIPSRLAAVGAAVPSA